MAGRAVMTMAMFDNDRDNGYDYHHDHENMVWCGMVWCGMVWYGVVCVWYEYDAI